MNKHGKIKKTKQQIRKEIMGFGSGPASSRKSYFQQLQANLIRYEQLFANMSSGVIICSFVKNKFIVTNINSAAEKMDGIKKSDVFGKNIFSIFPSFKKYGLEGIIAKVYETNSSCQLEAIHFAEKDISGWREFNIYSLPATQDIVCLYVDVSAQMEAEEQLLKTNRTLYRISQINQAIFRIGDEEKLLDECCKIITSDNLYPSAWIGYFDPQHPQEIKLATQSGFGSGLEKTIISLKSSKTFYSELLKNTESKQAVTTKNNPENFSTKKNSNFMIKHACGSVIAMPIIIDHKVVAAFVIFCSQINHFDSKTQSIFQELSEDISHAVKSCRVMEEKKLMAQRLKEGQKKLKCVLVEMIEAMGNAMEKRDPYTAGHQKRVSEIAVGIAKEMKLSDEDIECLRLAASIHDIGKMYIPTETLSKPGKLSAIEFEIIKTHPQAGYDIIKNIEFTQPISTIILQHHERIDGSGYPSQLRGNEIDILSKIISVSDVVEAISSHRPYRPSLGIDAALNEIKQNSGKLYDPDIVDACIRFFESGGA